MISSRDLRFLGGCIASGVAYPSGVNAKTSMFGPNCSVLRRIFGSKAAIVIGFDGIVVIIMPNPSSVPIAGNNKKAWCTLDPFTLIAGVNFFKYFW